MPYKLYLDDIRLPTDTYKTTKNSEWVIVRTYDDFVKVITEKGLPFIVSFDHDLADAHYPFNEVDGGICAPRTIPYDTYKEKTGYHAAKWLIDYCIEKKIDLPACNVHSANPVGKANIISILQSYEKFRKREAHPTTKK